ncbi:MAG: 1-acylglycerol-3-phosphate O-acyltransferase [Psychrosphaera sp.]|nr:1-acylglycerol-3-phosphate O-acyltransferase [Psychrosphaera sp.]
MIAAVRIVVIFCYFLFVCIFGCLFSLMRPFHPNNVRLVSQALGRISWLLGVEVEVRIPESIAKLGSCVYVANHQNSLDLFLIALGVQPYTVTVGKKSLRWIPFFGQLYWFSGNILIDRNHRGKAFNTIAQTVKKIKDRGISVWMFPEGTRSYGRGLLPFKTGAFHTAIQAEVPLVPLCLSSTTNKVKLNRWNNGKVIIEIMEPWKVEKSDAAGVRDLADQVRELMKNKIISLDKELKDAG